MKKFIFFLFISMLFFACSKDEKTPDTPDESGLVFEIMLQTQLKLTKVGTPLYSQEPTHNIANVSIYAFENDGADNYLFVKQYEISDWTPGMSLKRHVVPEDEELPAGYRTVFNLYTFEDKSHKEIAQALAGFLQRNFRRRVLMQNM